MKGTTLGEFEEITLLAVCAIEPPVYGVPVQRFVEQTAGRTASIGAIYAALERLETKGFLRSAFGDATPERGGKRKRLFDITPAGMRTLKELRRVRERIWRAIEERS